MGVYNDNTMYVRIPVKPYCYRYLCNNFGIQGKAEGYICLRRNRLLSTAFKSLLHHKSKLSGIKARPARWKNREVLVAIKQHDLNSHGLDLTDEGKSIWAWIVEQICQEDFRQFFIHMYMVEPRIKVIIDRYHKLRGYTEEDWPQESLQKIVTRMHITGRIREARHVFLQKYDDFFTTSLSTFVDSNKKQKLLSQLCNSTSTTEEA